MIASFKTRAKVEELCQWADVSKSSFHYKAHPGERGMKVSTHTPIGEGLVENQFVVDQIRAILSMDYCVYGYQTMTAELRSMEYLINKKKVYRLMKENRLLCGKVIRTQGKRTWVKFRRIEAKQVMEYLCLDIKYVWVHGDNRWYYQLSIMECILTQNPVLDFSAEHPSNRRDSTDASSRSSIRIKRSDHPKR